MLKGQKADKARKKRIGLFRWELEEKYDKPLMFTLDMTKFWKY